MVARNSNAAGTEASDKRIRPGTPPTGWAMSERRCQKAGHATARPNTCKLSVLDGESSALRGQKECQVAVEKVPGRETDKPRPNQRLVSALPLPTRSGLDEADTTAAHALDQRAESRGSRARLSAKGGESGPSTLIVFHFGPSA